MRKLIFGVSILLLPIIVGVSIYGYFLPFEYEKDVEVESVLTDFLAEV